MFSPCAKILGTAIPFPPPNAMDRLPACVGSGSQVCIGHRTASCEKQTWNGHLVFDLASWRRSAAWRVGKFASLVSHA
jgi:hypothetical protein